MLDSLHIKNFRCFEDLTIPSLGRVNLIVGKNNSGKSTLLEAVYLYANGGNAWAMAEILMKRNEFFSGISEQPKKSFNSLANIFHGNVFFDTNTDKDILLITSTLNLDDSLLIKYTNKTHEPIKAENDIIDVHMKHPSDSEYLRVIFKKEMLQMEISSSTITSHIKRIYEIQNTIANSKISTEIPPDNEISFLWDKAQDTFQEEKIEDILRIIEPNFSRLFFVADENDESNKKRIGKVRLKNNTSTRTLKSMGEGMSRLLQVFLSALQAKSGFLLIDEFENGLHYSIQEEVWEKLFKLAKELDIQVFATTHSEDTIKAFCKVSLADDEVDGKLISLGRSAAIADNGKILADVYDEKTLAWIVQSGMEVR